MSIKLWLYAQLEVRIPRRRGQQIGKSVRKTGAHNMAPAPVFLPMGVADVGLRGLGYYEQQRKQ